MSKSATSPISQSDVMMLQHLADSMGFGRTHDMLRRVISACPYLTYPKKYTGDKTDVAALVSYAQSLEQQLDEARSQLEKARSALAWLENLEPQIVESALEKFKVSLSDDQSDKSNPYAWNGKLPPEDARD